MNKQEQAGQRGQLPRQLQSGGQTHLFEALKKPERREALRDGVGQARDEEFGTPGDHGEKSRCQECQQNSRGGEACLRA